MDLKINDVTYRLTTHAKYRMSKRCVSMDDLVEALTNIKYRKIQHRHGEEDRGLISGRNKVTAVVSTSNVIITVYNYNKEYYRNKNKKAYNSKRRTLKQQYGNRLKR